MTTTKWTRIRTEHLSINAQTDVSTKGKQKMMKIRTANTIVFQLSALIFKRIKSLTPILHSLSRLSNICCSTVKWGNVVTFFAQNHIFLRIFFRCLIYHIFTKGTLSVCGCVCVSQLRNAQALLFVLVIKLTKEMRRRVWRGRD
jgi:hypothetical protein